MDTALPSRVFLSVLAGLIGCQDSADPMPVPESDLLALTPTEPGPYAIGHRVWDARYTLVTGEERNITVNAWYPTEATTGDPVLYIGLDPDEDVLGNATPTPHPSGQYPLHVHSHGHQGYGGTSADLMRWYASHGWLALAPDHVADRLLLDDPSEEPVGFHASRALDIHASVDSLDALPSGDPLAGMTDTSAYVLSGHSRGVRTTWTVLGATLDPAGTDHYCSGCTPEQLAQFSDGSLVDPRAVVGLPMAGTASQSWFGDTGHRTVTAPVLSMTGTNDDVGQSEQWDRIDQIGFRWLEIEGGCHQTFALGVCDTLSTEEGYWMVNSYALAMGRVFLLDDSLEISIDLLNEGSALDPRAQLRLR